MDLNIIWFILIVVLLIGYAILDGFDLGIGTFYLSFKKDKDRQILLKTFGPFWNGNEVWLLAGGGALFAAFPNAYASIFSGLYIPLMLLLAALIFRGVAIEFRNKEESEKWRKNWDYALSIGSIFILLVLGVAVGNLIQGLPIDENGNINLLFLKLFTPFPIIVGLQSVFFFALHGSIYAAMKTEDELQDKIANKSKLFLYIAFVLFITSFALNNIVDFLSVLNIVVVVLFIVLFLLINNKKIGLSFVVSSAIALLYIANIAIYMFPNFAISTISTEFSLNAYNAASSQKTLETMLIIAGIGVPIVLAYTIFVYRIFKGKVRIDSEGY